MQVFGHQDLRNVQFRLSQMLGHVVYIWNNMLNELPKLVSAQYIVI